MPFGSRQIFDILVFPGSMKGPPAQKNDLI